MKNDRAGFALIEVLVGIVVLAIASAGLVGLLVQCDDSLQRSWRSEQAVAAATEAVTRVSLWTRDRLESNAGSVRVGGVALRITPLPTGLYDVGAFRENGTLLLSTTLYRSADAP